MNIINSYNKSITDCPAIKELIEKLANVKIEEHSEIPPHSVTIAREFIYKK